MFAVLYFDPGQQVRNFSVSTHSKVELTDGSLSLEAAVSAQCSSTVYVHLNSLYGADGEWCAGASEERHALRRRLGRLVQSEVLISLCLLYSLCFLFVCDVTNQFTVVSYSQIKHSPVIL